MGHLKKLTVMISKRCFLFYSNSLEALKHILLPRAVETLFLINILNYFTKSSLLP